MKKIIYLFLVFAILGSCKTKKIVEMKPEINTPKPLTTKIDTMSYAFGLSVAETFAKIQEDSEGEINLDVDVFSAAIREQLDGKPRMSQEEMQQTLQQLGQELQAKAQKQQEMEGMKAVEEGRKFLEKNATAEGVKTTASGLQYKVLQEGSGNSPVATDKVKVHYTGKLLDGTVFDSSVERGEPISFALNQVIPGWTEGVQLMKTGAKYEFTIPSELAYGAQGAPGAIPPNSVLIFYVELIDIEK